MKQSCFFLFLDFDEQTADDWDVDMSVYYDKGNGVIFYNLNRNMYFTHLFFFNSVLPCTDGGDMDSRDYIKMRYEKRLRDGLEVGSGQNQSIGSFERFSKVRNLL